jgi:hypothetical protein
LSYLTVVFVLIAVVQAAEKKTLVIWVAEGFGLPVEETQLNWYVGFGQIGDVPSSDNLKKLQKTNTLTGYLNSDIFP